MKKTHVLSPPLPQKAPPLPFSTIVAVGRAFFMVGCTLWHLVPLLIQSAVWGHDMNRSLRVRKRWAPHVLGGLGVRIWRTSPLPQHEGPALYVGNHRSYLDPIVVLRDVEALPVAKAEVASWPLIGFAAKATGIMYVKRQSKRSRLSTLMAIRQTLINGHSVLLYPEGTTHLQARTISFRKGGFRVAAELGIPVIPIAIDYPDSSNAWVGDDAFIPHFLRVFGKKFMDVYISYGPPLYDDDPEHLIRRTREWIDEQLARWPRLDLARPLK